MHPKSSKKKQSFNLSDTTAKILITAGGIATITAVLGIFVFIFVEAIPLWFPSGKTTEAEFQTAMEKAPLAIGIDEHQEMIWKLWDDGKINFYDVETKNLKKTYQIPTFENAHITSFSRNLTGNKIGLGASNGNAILVDIIFETRFRDTNRIITPGIDIKKTVKLDSSNRSIHNIAHTSKNSNFTAAGLIGKDTVLYYSEFQKRGLLSSGEKQIIRGKIHSGQDSEITDIALDEYSSSMTVAYVNGLIDYYLIENYKVPKLVASQKVSNSKITDICYLNGGESIIVGSEKGEVSSWISVLPDEESAEYQLVKSHTFRPLESRITGITAASRNKAFIVSDDKGNSELKYLTSEQTLLNFHGINQPTADAVISQKFDGALILYGDGTIKKYSIDAPHPEVTLETIFGKVWYEGYDEPSFVWQSTGGSNDFEPKLSLVPLIIGTLKGTFYALLFAIPIAILGAIWTALFSSQRIKTIVKPTVEIMAALPSVVIGLIAGLWLAPLLENILPAVIVTIILLPLIIFSGVKLWHNSAKIRAIKIKPGYEILFLIPLVLITIQLALWLAPSFENLVFNGDYRIWIQSFLEDTYNQRNGIVVGFAMGFAVIPIIFTICEDSLSSVPKSLYSASLALGASRWQTAFKIVLPSALPGIFSAVMIGLGRAIGETMIVLMCTGNTPILSFSPFNGMRTLSANIAIEIMEAPYHGTLYRVLFLSAALLFVLTFIINTGAEIIRTKLKKRIAQY